MKKLLTLSLFALCLSLLGAGCASSQQESVTSPLVTRSFSEGLSVPSGPTAPLGRGPSASPITLPVEGYAEHRTLKTFGTFVQDRFYGYHTGDDVEIPDKEADVLVYAIADGEVIHHQFTSGYGGVIVLRHVLDEREIFSLYGHLDLSSSFLKVGSTVRVGDELAYLGADTSPQTDGERKHLHFSLYEGPTLRLAGYVSSARELENWIDPQVFFEEYGYEF